MKFIEFKCGGPCKYIEQCISGVLLARGDFSFVRELNNLKVRLKSFRRRAIAARNDDQDGDVPQTYQTDLPHRNSQG